MTRGWFRDPERHREAAIKGKRNKVGRDHQGKLTKKQRDSIPTKYFAGPNRSFPVEDRGHVRSALGHLKDSHYSPAQKREIRKNIERREKQLGME